MKRMKVISMVLVLSLVLMGAGYAYWTDSVVINNTVTTGTFNMKFVYPVPGVDSAHGYDTVSYNDYIIGQLDGEAGIGIAPDTAAHQLNFNFTNYYPGSGANMKFRIVNDGTVPVKLDSLSLVGYDAETEENLANKLRYTLKQVELKKDSGTLVSTLVNGDAPLVYTNLTAFEAGLQTLLSTVTIGVDEYIEVNGPSNSLNQPTGYEIFYPLGDDADNTTENSTLDFDIEFVWTQWNEIAQP